MYEIRMNGGIKRILYSNLQQIQMKMRNSTFWSFG